MLQLNYPILLVFLLFACQTSQKEAETTAPSESSLFIKKTNHIVYSTFTRISIKQKLETKVKQQIPLVIHVLVPLCDNENQGIVRVPEKLGNGMDPGNNLYWGALYGLKTHLKRSKGWKMIKTEINPSPKVLERVVFERKFGNGATTYLVADAYRGDEMKACVQDYLAALAGKVKSKLHVSNDLTIGIKGEADFLIFNGHNGLMDYNISPVENEDGIEKDAAVIGCISFDYFEEHLKAGKGYPLITTTNLMAPEAYILEGMANAWSNLEEGAEIKEAVAQAYHQYQKCGIRGARRLFKTGW